MKKYIAIVDYENNAEEFWEAFESQESALDPTSGLHRRFHEMLLCERTEFDSESSLEFFWYCVSSLLGWGSGPDHAKRPIIFLETYENE